MLTQAELIARALDNEEGNIVSHRDYLKLEDEKRQLARVVRTAVSGPLLRWISKVEEEEKITAVPAPAPTPASTYSYYGLYNQPTGNAASETRTQTSSGPFRYQYYQPPGTYGVNTNPTPSTSTQPPPPQSHYPSYVQAPQPPPPPPVKEKEKVEKNYVVHESAQVPGIRPQWGETMQTMFGDHVNWEEVKVYTGKNRPLSRPKRTCPITGKQANYFDPRTGVPYADVRAYKVLTGILNHEYVWSPTMRCYVGKEESTAATNAGSSVVASGSRFAEPMAVS